MDHLTTEAAKNDDVSTTGSNKRLSLTMSLKELDAEKVLDAFGKYGPYQMKAYVLITAVLMLYSSQMMIMSFISTAPEFECDIKQNEAESKSEYTIIDSCYVNDSNNVTILCNEIPNASFKFNESSPQTTLNSEFNLVCRDEHWAQHASSLFLLGGLLVTPFTTQLSDLYGRRYAFLISLWTAVTAAVACSFAPTYGWFLLFRFITGVGTSSYATVGWVFCCESVSVKFRSFIPVVGTFAWVSGIMLVGILRVFISNWRWLYFAVSLPGLLTYSYYWYIEKSSTFNHKTISIPDCKSSTTKLNEGNSRTFIDMVKNKAIVFHLTIHCLIITKLSDDSYTGYFLSGLVEIPAGLLCIPLLLKFGRRTITFWCLALQGVSMGAAILYPGPGTIEMIFPVVAKLFNSILWTSEPLLLAEMSPTSIRDIFYGLVTFFGEFGSVLAPYLELLKDIDERAPQTVVAILSAGASMLVLTAPETKNKPMPEDLDQFDIGCLLRRFACCRQTPKDNNEYGIQTLPETEVRFVGTEYRS
ncbi:unnamed protein product [Anisakis simplex]|uniref:MFS domain-containing protein n=1 Tax=Anisakis simplex TaxID=6269 RepID=A0A0M3JZT7_ANISI|nr:unnamed protein product [Anisakis simplex]